MLRIRIKAEDTTGRIGEISTFIKQGDVFPNLTKDYTERCITRPLSRYFCVKCLVGTLFRLARLILIVCQDAGNKYDGYDMHRVMQLLVAWNYGNGRNNRVIFHVLGMFYCIASHPESSLKSGDLKMFIVAMKKAKFESLGYEERFKPLDWLEIVADCYDSLIQIAKHRRAREPEVAWVIAGEYCERPALDKVGLERFYTRRARRESSRVQ